MRSSGISVAELARAAGVSGVADGETVIAGIQYDSRLITAGDLFVALRGAYFDGHQYVGAAKEAGAVALLVEEPMQSGLPEIVVGDTREALAPVAAEFYRHPSRELRVAGVTGTDGKTTTTYLLDAIARSAGLVTGLIGTVAVRIANEVVEHETRQTTPESLDIQRYLRTMVDAGVDLAILEATSHGLDLHRLDEVRFVAGGVTNITREHLDYHKTIAAYRRAKAILFERVSESAGVAVVNLDDEGAREMLNYSAGATVVTYSVRDPRGDLRASDLDLRVDRSAFQLAYAGQSWRVELPYVGAFNVENALCALGMAFGLGIEPSVAIEGLRTAPPVPGRMVAVDRGQPFTVIVDYAHTPESLEKIMRLLRSLNPKGRLIAVSGSAGERDTTKRPLQGAVSARLADFSIFTTEDPRFEDADAIIDQIAEGARGLGKQEGTDFLRITDRREAIRRAIELATPGDVILLAGKGHERSIIWGLEKRPWDEAAVAAELLEERFRV